MAKLISNPPAAGSKRKLRGAATFRAVLETLESRRLLAESIWAYPGADDKLLYKPLPLGDKIQDFSDVGYKAGLESIPDVPVKITVSPIVGDDQTSIQNAINFVQGLTPDANGIRGAVLLNPGTYEIPGTLTISTSGVVLRGSGQGQTILLATGTEKDTTVQLNGDGSRSTVSGSTQTISDKYVPVGAISFTVPNGAAYAVGDSVMIHRSATTNWLHDIGMDQLTNPWTSRNVDMDRTITRIDGNVITIDAPITHALDVNYGGGQIWKYTATGRISNVGVEYITGRSTYDDTIRDGNDRVDENHAEHFIGVDGVINGWVRNVTSEFYGYSCVNMTGPSKWVTVQDSQCLDPVSVVTGGRRYSFNMGDSTGVLWQNLYTRSGRHDYVQGSEVTGPNVVVDSRSDATRADIGPHHRYSTGTLWDNIKGGEINIQNRWDSGSGHGWAGANQVVWNSEASSFIIQNIGFPNTAWDWAIGNIGTQSTGDFIAPDNTQVGSTGLYDSHGTHVDTRSLFRAQMNEKLAVDNRMLREVRLGDADNYVGGNAADAVTVDAAWKTAVQNATGQSGVNFDAVAANQLVPFTFNFGIDPGTYVVGASLSLGYKSASGVSAGDTIFFESTGRRYTWAELGVAPPTTSQGAVVIDLAKLLPALQDGKLNLAISGDTAIDWATLTFQTGSITSPKITNVIASDDAYVDQALPGNNFGGSGSMFTKRNGASDNRESYLKFDVTSISGTIANAYIRLVPTTVGVAPSSVASTFGNATGAIFNRLSFVQNDTWTEGAINWSNKPAADPFFREFMAYPNEPLLFDVTSLVRAAQAGDKKLSLSLSTYVDNASSQSTYATSENGNAELSPQLVIKTLDSVGAAADAYVRGGASATGNFGTTTDLPIKNDSSASPDNDREAYLRFDLNGLPGAPTNAFLRLMPFNVPATLQHSAQLVTDDTWSETGITWNNKPAGSTVLGSWTPAVGQYVSVNVSGAATSAYTSDKLLSVKIVSDTASSAAAIQYGSRENASELLRPLLISSNFGPAVTTIPNVSTGLNTPVSGKWFGVWDAETPLNSLTVTATSSNTTLLPNANIALGGSGIDRTFSLTPASGQSGASNVTITVTDAQGQQAQATFQLLVVNSTVIDGDQSSPNQADTFLVVRSGSNVNIFRNAVLVANVPQVSAGAYQLNGLGGLDTLIVDYSGGNPIPAGGLALDGGSGADIVRVLGGSSADAVTLTSGNVSVASGGAFAYAAGETLELTLGAGGDSLSVAGNAAVAASAMNLTVSAGGTLAMAASSSLPTFADLSVLGTFNLAGQNQTIDQITGSGVVANNTSATTATLTVGQDNSSCTFGGSLTNGSGTLALTKTGTGKLTLTGVNSFSGTTTISGGVIEAGPASAFLGLTGQVHFLSGTVHVTGTSGTVIVSAGTSNKFTTSGTSGSTGTFDIDSGVTLQVGALDGSGQPTLDTAGLQTAGSGSAGSFFFKKGAGTLRIVSRNNQLDVAMKLDEGAIDLWHARGLGGADGINNHLDMKAGTTLILRQNVDTNFLTPISVDPGAAVNVVIDRLSAGAGVTHSINAVTSSGACTINVSTGSNVTTGTAGFSIGSATFGGDATVNVATASANVTITGVVAGGFALTKLGAGKLTFASTNTFSAVSVTGGTLALTAGGGRVLKTSSLSISGAKLDLADNDLVIDYSGASPIGGKSGSIYTGATGMIQSGRNGGAWNGNGMITSQSDALTGLKTLGIGEAANVLGLASGATALWNGVTVDDKCVLVQYTFTGDANLDAVIDGDDFFAIDGGFAAAGSGFANGDFNYDCRVDADDYWLIDSNYPKAASLAPAAPAQVSGSSELPPLWPAAIARKDDLLVEDLHVR